MYKEVEKIEDLLMHRLLEMDSVAHTNGDNLTLNIAQEECAELIQAISKVKRYGFKADYKGNMQEEIADVLICIVELMSLGYVDIEEVTKWYKYKVEREVTKARKKKEEQK